MTSLIINPAAEAKKKAAIAIGHQLSVVDQVLKTSTDGYQAQVTLGWTTPQDTLMPSITLVMPMPFVRELSEALATLADKADEQRGKAQKRTAKKSVTQSGT